MSYYKLNKSNLIQLVKKGLISVEDANMIEKISLERKPGKHATKHYKVYLNKAHTVYIQSIHFYGGENFNEPYYWVAEISNLTQTGLTRYFNENNIRLPSMEY